MTIQIEKLKDKWKEQSHLASGMKVVEVFGDAAMESWEGAEALIDAYLELEEQTGESSYRQNISDLMYFKIKEYWSEELSVEQLDKLDRFLSKF